MSQTEQGRREVRQYYSIRTGKNPRPKFDLPLFRRLFLSMYRHFEGEGYFQEYFGYYCVDGGDIPGKLGSDLEGHFLRALRKIDVWPIDERYQKYSEEDLFDVIEFLYDYVSSPVDGYHHSYGDCGWHYEEFDRQEGRDEYRSAMNEQLRDYRQGYELTDKGEIRALPPPGMAQLFEAQVPTGDENKKRVEAAIEKFRGRNSSIDDRRHAVRDLADVLEFLRPKVKCILTKKDERDMFELANRFGIRHHNERQQTQYDPAIWLSWVFYYYLASIHALTRLLEKRDQDEGSQ